MNVDQIRASVSDFFTRYPIGRTSADAFPAWWIRWQYEIAGADAVRRCSNGAGDFGVDGFFIEQGGDRGPTLQVIQAKMSSSRRNAHYKKLLDRALRKLPLDQFDVFALE